MMREKMSVSKNFLASFWVVPQPDKVRVPALSLSLSLMGEAASSG
jgi:hypothetical protein